MIDLVLKYLEPVLLAVVAGLLGMLLRALKRLPRFFIDFADHLVEEAKRTPGIADDVATRLLAAFAHAFDGALDSTFDDRTHGKHPPAAPPPAPPVADTTRFPPQTPLSGRSPPR